MVNIDMLNKCKNVMASCLLKPLGLESIAATCLFSFSIFRHNEPEINEIFLDPVPGLIGKLQQFSLQNKIKLTLTRGTILNAL